MLSLCSVCIPVVACGGDPGERSMRRPKPTSQWRTAEYITPVRLSAKTREELCDILERSPRHRDAKRMLTQVTTILESYSQYKAFYDDRPTPTAIRAELDPLVKSCRDARERLESLTDAAYQKLCHVPPVKGKEGIQQAMRFRKLEESLPLDLEY